MYIHMYIYTYICIYVYLYKCMHVYTCVHVCVCMYVCIYVCMYVCTVHTYNHTHTIIHMQSCAFKSEARYRRRRRTCHGRDLLLLRRCRRPGTHSQYSFLQMRCIVNALGQWLSRMSVIVPDKSLSLSLSLSLSYLLYKFTTHIYYAALTIQMY